MEDGACDRRTKERDCLVEEEWRRIWENLEGAWYFGKHDKIILPPKSECHQVAAGRTYLPDVWQAGDAESGAAGKEVLLRQMPKEVVERPYRADEGKRRLRPLRETVTSRTDLETAMSREALEREAAYQSAMRMFRSLWEKGVLSCKDYLEAERMMREKYKPALGTLFSDISLT